MLSFVVYSQIPARHDASCRSFTSSTSCNSSTSRSLPPLLHLTTLFCLPSTLFSAIAQSYPSRFQWLAHSFPSHGGCIPQHGWSARSMLRFGPHQPFGSSLNGLPLQTSNSEDRTSKSDELTHIESHSCIKHPGVGYKSQHPAKIRVSWTESSGFPLAEMRVLPALSISGPAPTKSGSEPSEAGFQACRAIAVQTTWCKNRHIAETVPPTPVSKPVERIPGAKAARDAEPGFQVHCCAVVHEFHGRAVTLVRSGRLESRGRAGKAGSV